MLQLKRTLASMLASLLLVFSLISTHIVPISFVAATATITATQTACGPDDLSKLHDVLNKAAKTLNTAVDTNGQLYEKGFYGPVGSVAAVDKLHKGAQIIKDAAGNLQIALNLAKALTKETFASGKLAVLQALTLNMPLTGNQTLDLVLQSVTTLVNQAVAIVQLFQSNHLEYVLPRIQKWELPEVKVTV